MFSDAHNVEACSPTPFLSKFDVSTDSARTPLCSHEIDDTLPSPPAVYICDRETGSAWGGVAAAVCTMFPSADASAMEKSNLGIVDISELPAATESMCHSPTGVDAEKNHSIVSGPPHQCESANPSVTSLVEAQENHLQCGTGAEDSAPIKGSCDVPYTHKVCASSYDHTHNGYGGEGTASVAFHESSGNDCQRPLTGTVISDSLAPLVLPRCESAGMGVESYAVTTNELPDLYQPQCSLSYDDKPVMEKPLDKYPRLAFHAQWRGDGTASVSLRLSRVVARLAKEQRRRRRAERAAAALETELKELHRAISLKTDELLSERQAGLVQGEISRRQMRTLELAYKANEEHYKTRIAQLKESHAQEASRALTLQEEKKGLQRSVALAETDAQRATTRLLEAETELRQLKEELACNGTNLQDNRTNLTRNPTLGREVPTNAAGQLTVIQSAWLAAEELRVLYEWHLHRLNDVVGGITDGDLTKGSPMNSIAESEVCASINASAARLGIHCRTEHLSNTARMTLTSLSGAIEETKRRLCSFKEQYIQTTALAFQRMHTLQLRDMEDRFALMSGAIHGLETRIQYHGESYTRLVQLLSTSVRRRSAIVDKLERSIKQNNAQLAETQERLCYAEGERHRLEGEVQRFLAESRAAEQVERAAGILLEARRTITASIRAAVDDYQAIASVHVESVNEPFLKVIQEAVLKVEAQAMLMSQRVSKQPLVSQGSSLCSWNCLCGGDTKPAAYRGLNPPAGNARQDPLTTSTECFILDVVKQQLGNICRLIENSIRQAEVYAIQTQSRIKEWEKGLTHGLDRMYEAIHGSLSLFHVPSSSTTYVRRAGVGIADLSPISQSPGIASPFMNGERRQDPRSCESQRSGGAAYARNSCVVQILSKPQRDECADSPLSAVSSHAHVCCGEFKGWAKDNQFAADPLHSAHCATCWTGAVAQEGLRVGARVPCRKVATPPAQVIHTQEEQETTALCVSPHHSVCGTCTSKPMMFAMGREHPGEKKGIGVQSPGSGIYRSATGPSLPLAPLSESDGQCCCRKNTARNVTCMRSPRYTPDMSYCQQLRKISLPSSPASISWGAGSCHSIKMSNQPKSTVTHVVPCDGAASTPSPRAVMSDSTDINGGTGIPRRSASSGCITFGTRRFSSEASR